MAARRGLHASQFEAEQAWRDVTVKREEDRLGTAWRRLFKGHSVAPSPIRLLTKAQLPAWVVTDGCVGILRSLPEADKAADIEWLEDKTPEADVVPEEALVPVAPLTEGDESFLPEDERGPATQAILAGLKAHTPIFRKVAVASIVMNIIAVLASLFVMQVYDRVVPNFAYATLWFLATGLFVGYIIDFMLKMVRMKLMDESARQLDEGMSLYVFDRLLALKLDRRPTRLGSLVAQVRDYESIKAFFTSSTLFAVVDLPFIILFIGVIWAIGGPVAWVPAVFAIVCLIVGIVAYKPTYRLQRANMDAATRRQGLLYEAVAGGDIIKSQGGEAHFGDQWLSTTRETADRSIALNAVTSISNFVTQFMQHTAYAGIVVVGVYVIEQGELTMGGLIACSILGGRALGNIAGITSVIMRWHHARYSLGVLNNLLAGAADDSPDRQANVRSQPLHLSLHDVVYAYPGSELPQLVAPALEIPAGDRVAILGRNGSGKTTLLKLLAGIATPARGQVHIAGLDYEECRPSWLREVIGYLPQDPRMFSGTLVENLTLGMTMPSEEAIFDALDKTGLAEAVRNHPKGLLLPIAEGGSGMSGGQRQLVALTRLVLQNPKIWLLDEPTASLDSEVENKVMTIIRDLAPDRTVLFTTHKRAWLELSNRVLVVDEGQVKSDMPTEQVLGVGAVSASGQGQARSGGAA